MDSSPRRGAYPIVVLAVLILAYTFNFLDRQILGILAGAIKQDLGLTDSQLGLMGGLAFAPSARPCSPRRRAGSSTTGSSSATFHRCMNF